MQSKSWNVLLGFAVIAALFSLYSVIYFWTIQDIADPNSIARIRFDQKCWLIAFVALTILTILISYYRQRTRK